jgi:nitrite reductase/ring-hydroxylating ferredoxin subunit
MPSSRFPFPIPFGWFAVGRVDELPAEPVSTHHLFGRELVLWTDGADRHLVDAHCPHLGAHLGVGGRVADCCLVCPFHEWSFDGDGTNVAIPYADRPNRRARLRGYPLVERNGLLLAWYHPDASVEPIYEVPQKVVAGAQPVHRVDREVATVWQEIAENSVDMAHFVSVHGTAERASVGEMTVDGPIRQVRSEQTFTSSKGDLPATLVSTSLGAGLGYIEFGLFGHTVVLVSATTPLDDDRCLQRFTFYTDGSDVAAKIAPGFAAEVERQFDQDIPIWESKAYVAVPALAPSEKPVTEFRRWAAQFYAEAPAS